MEYILGVLINDISSIKEDFLLVIDDYHLIDSKDVHNNFFYLLEHLPPRMHVAIATRSDPPIMLARLRSQAQIIELRANGNILYRTSILDRMNGPLCNTVTGQHNSQSILDSLEQANLFIIPLDDHRNWYRYHHLFAELLKRRLRDAMPKEVKDLHHRASLGFEDQGFVTEAIDHAFKAEDYSRAEFLISRIAEQLWFKGEQGILLRWIALLPKNRGAVNPGLYAILAMCVSLAGRFDDAGLLCGLSCLWTGMAQGNQARLDNFHSYDPVCCNRCVEPCCPGTHTVEGDIDFIVLCIPCLVFLHGH